MKDTHLERTLKPSEALRPLSKDEEALPPTKVAETPDKCLFPVPLRAVGEKAILVMHLPHSDGLILLPDSAILPSDVGTVIDPGTTGLARGDVVITRHNCGVNFFHSDFDWIPSSRQVRVIATMKRAFDDVLGVIAS